MTDVRLTQDVVEVVEESAAADVRVTQVVAEGVEASAQARVRLTQMVIELIFPVECPTQSPPTPTPVEPGVGCPIVMPVPGSEAGSGCRLILGVT